MRIRDMEKEFKALQESYAELMKEHIKLKYKYNLLRYLQLLKEKPISL